MKKRITILIALALAALVVFAACTDKSPALMGQERTIDNLAIKFTEVKQAETTQGNVLVGVKFTIKNNRSNSFTVYDVFDFDCKYNGENAQYVLTHSFGESLNGALAADDERTGWFVLRVPASWTELTIYFQPDLLKSYTDGQAFIVKNTDVTT